MKLLPRLIPAVVWTVFAVMLLLVLRFVSVYGVNLPFWDEWESIVPQLGGTAPLTGEWLWSPWNEHRVLLPRLLMLAVLGVTGGNFKAMMLFNVLLLGAACSLILLAIGRIRAGESGYRWSITDAFFPVLILHTGHWENLIWSFQIQFISSAFLIALLLFVASTRKSVNAAGSLSFSYVVSLAAILIALALTGGNGLVYTPIGAVCLVSIGVAVLRAGNNTKRGWLAVGAGVAVLTTVVLYFHGLTLHTPAGNAPVTLRTMAQTALNYLSIGFGRGMHPFWDSNRSMRIVGVCFAIGLAAGIYLFTQRHMAYTRRVFSASAALAASAVLGVLLARSPSPSPFDLFALALIPLLLLIVILPGLRSLWENRADAEATRRLLWIGVVISGALLAAIAVGKGRAVLGTDAGLVPRYGVLSAQLLVGIYFAAVLQKRSLFAERFVTTALFAISVALLPANRYDAKTMSDIRRRTLTEFQRRANDGVSLEVLTAMSSGMHPNENAVKTGIQGLRARGYKQFATVSDAPEVRHDLSRETLRLPKILVHDPANKPLRISIPPTYGKGTISEIVIRYEDYGDPYLLSNYRVVALRRTATGFVEQGKPETIPNPGYGALLLLPNGPVDAVELRPVPDSGGHGPVNLSISRISLFQRSPENPVAVGK